MGKQALLSRLHDAKPDDGLGILFERSPVAMWILDPATFRIVGVNDAACSLYGYKRAEFLRKSAFDLRPPQDNGAFIESIEQIGASYRPDRTRTHVTASGETLRILPFAQRIRFEGRPCLLMWSIEVTEEAPDSTELRSTQIFLNAVVESIPSMVFVKDVFDGRFVLLNKAGEDLLGVGRNDLIGKTDYDLFDPADAFRFRAADEAVIASGELVTIENEPLTTPDGVRSLRTQKVGVPDADGKPRYLLGISEDVTERLKVEELNRHLSLHDVLTDLPNRLLFHNMLEQRLAEADGGRGNFALLFLDLDGFKSVNDSLGHHAGDDLLRQLASRLRAVNRADNFVGRLGGDEFGVLHFGDVDEASGSALAERLIALVSEPFEIDGQVVSVGCSIGIVLNSKHGDGGEALMKRADLALYAVKSTGKGGFAWFEAAMEEKADHERSLRHELATALEQGQLEVHYQPIVDTATGETVCCEALLRWRHPERGMVPPADFIPIAEASGVIEPIGRWVLEQACGQAATWPEHVRIAVNLSPRQFTGLDLAADVMRALTLAKLAPNRLELEITESVLLADSQENLRVLQMLKKIGVRIALDDFGTGYSSLSYLRRLAFDKLKIDRTFVADVTSSPESLAIVRAVIGLGKSFSAIVTAEGVETDEQYQCLIQEGCDQAQGFLFGRSMTGGEIALRLADVGGHSRAGPLAVGF